MGSLTAQIDGQKNRSCCVVLLKHVLIDSNPCNVKPIVSE